MSAELGRLVVDALAVGWPAFVFLAGLFVGAWVFGQWDEA